MHTSISSTIFNWLISIQPEYGKKKDKNQNSIACSQSETMPSIFDGTSISFRFYM